MNNAPEDIDDWKNYPVAITGGAGFIGSTLARRLSDLGADVTVIDSLIPSYGGNLFNLHGYKDKIRLNLSDIRDPYSLKSLLRNQKVIFNLAGQTSHMDSMTDPVTDLEINCKAQLSLLEICRETNPTARIIFASTRQLYGRPTYLPVNEQHRLAPVDVNGINKLSAELYHQLYADIYDLTCCILRLTNTIGPRMRIIDAKQTFVGIWIRNLLEHKPIQVWGGQQWRDFNDVDDVVDALVLAAQMTTMSSGPFNLGSEERVTLLNLAEQLAALEAGTTIQVIEYPEERSKIDIGDYYSCHHKFTSATGWRPQRELSSTLSRTVAYYRQYLGAYTNPKLEYV